MKQLREDYVKAIGYYEATDAEAVYTHLQYAPNPLDDLLDIEPNVYEYGYSKAYKITITIEPV